MMLVLVGDVVSRISLLALCVVVRGTTSWRWGSDGLEGKRQHLLPPFCSKIDLT